MNDDEKKNQLLKFMAESGGFRGYNPGDLMAAFRDQLSQDEIEYLMGELIDDGTVGDCGTKDGPSIMFNQTSKNRLAGRYYLKNLPKPIRQSESMKEKKEPKAGMTFNGPVTIGGHLVQSVDSSTSINEPTQIKQSPINIKKIVKFIIWFLGAILTLYGMYRLIIGLMPPV